jgi:hypothetical protein
VPNASLTPDGRHCSSTFPFPELSRSYRIGPPAHPGRTPSRQPFNICHQALVSSSLDAPNQLTTRTRYAIPVFGPILGGALPPPLSPVTPRCRRFCLAMQTDTTILEYDLLVEHSLRRHRYSKLPTHSYSSSLDWSPARQHNTHLVAY